MQSFPMTALGRRCRDIVRAARRAPVSLTTRGRPDLVVLSAERYAELTRHEPRALHAWELEPHELEAIRTQPAGLPLSPFPAGSPDAPPTP